MCSNTYAEIQIDGTRPATPNYAQLWLSRFPAPTGPIVSATIHVVTEYKRNNATGGSPIVETLVFNAQNTNELAASVVAIEDYGGDSDQTKAEHTVTFTASQFAYDFPNGASDIWVKSWMWHTLWQAFSQTIVYRVYDAWIEYTYP